MKKIKTFFIKIWQSIKSIPWYGWVSTLLLLGIQRAFYRLAPIIANATGASNWAFAPKIPFDDSIPVVPFFIIIYILSFAFWFILPLVIAKKTSKENFINFCIYMFGSLFVGFIIFCFAPTYMDRVKEGLMDIGAKGGIFNILLQWMYDIDNGNIAYDLLPSYHCILTLCCYFGVCRKKEVSLSFRIFSLISVVLIVLSTLFTKQHYFLDIVDGIALAIVVFLLVKAFEPGKKIITHYQKKKSIKKIS